MKLEQKMRILHQVYEIYAAYTDTLALACRKQCCRCCTRNVTLTSLEAASILEGLQPTEKDRLQHKLQNAASLQRFQPQITTNEMAERCARDEALPEEHSDPGWGPCPLLEEALCTLYPLRPFACRCLISRCDCEISGSADIDEFSLTANIIFLQVIEHIDSGGCTGNFTDLLLCLLQPQNMSVYRNSRLDCTAAGLICNRPLKHLMIPPHHRNKATPLVRQLQQITIS